MHGVDNFYCIGTHQEIPTSFDGLYPFGFRPDGYTFFSEHVSFFLYSAGICDNAFGIFLESEGFQITCRFCCNRVLLGCSCSARASAALGPSVHSRRKTCRCRVSSTG